ncbi:MAG: hypothetical protein WBH84_05525 [Defluviitoga tunisiensis]|jgi:hypothetical protein|uniref:Uncharacterized protein n=1 Tax=Defluviitoga tunisiensis TaxID=1006576 RepID=A0A0C7NLY0_DEFTU|nr:hypothetical protein [Defluviitoga tunisiensis]MDD3601293.1 hypothetical protein [Defluviitoga tunisiensis]MDY0379511.1 hypothetical protein [Defluviitoga tunisiensis]CEP78906.1 hypothetical protein DTL3_1617 [Defluviitoga tunisiensis]HOB55570.1 hypothetical protein [Defluviitoga tunisiensis]HOL86202.1 hypothetical protein [Defluviitoga tunisiensis]
MQISLDQLLQVLMARLDSLEMSLEDLKFRTDVALRILRKNNLLDEDKVKEAVKEEFVLLNQLSDEKEEIDEEKIESITKGIINWVDNDVDYFKRQYADFQEKLRQFLEEEDKSNISVASPELLKQLESLKGENPKKNKNNFIIP